MPEFMKTDITDFGAILARVLDRVASSPRISQLNMEDTWFLLVETLLGHPPVNGFQRPADLPFTFTRQDVFALAKSLARQPQKHPTRNTSETCHASAFMLAYAVLANLQVANQTDKEPLYANAIRGLLHALLPDGQTRSPILAQLGLDECQTENPVSAYSLPAWNAAQACTIDYLGLSPEQKLDQFMIRLGLDARQRDARKQELSSPFFMVTIKTTKVQTLLKRCNFHYMHRGASQWCSMFLGIIRDDLTRQLQYAPPSTTLPRMLLIADCSALIRLISFDPIEANDIKSHLETCMHTSFDTIMRQRFPRLRPYLAITHSQEWLRALPDLMITVEQTTLFEMTTGGQLWQEDYTAAGALLTWPRNVQQQEAPQCCHINQAPAMCDESGYIDSLPWHEKSKDPRFYSWEACLYSLLGQTARLENQSVLTMYPAFRKLRQIKFLKQRCKALGLTPEDLIAIVKMDADRIGKWFVEQNPLQRPAASLQLSALLEEAYLASMQAVIEKHQCSVFPIDMCYFGGDDILLILPAAMLPDFLDAFDQNLHRSGNHDITLTYHAACVPLAEFDDHVMAVLEHMEQNLKRAKEITRNRQAPPPPSPSYHTCKNRRIHGTIQHSTKG